VPPHLRKHFWTTDYKYTYPMTYEEWVKQETLQDKWFADVRVSAYGRRVVDYVLSWFLGIDRTEIETNRFFRDICTGDTFLSDAFVRVMKKNASMSKFSDHQLVAWVLLMEPGRRLDKLRILQAIERVFVY
jgi:hypothetical protein